jgi:3-deoxy-manno-octulosonate cytidylyltransferase (CMP-KDO synthetase)
MTDFGVIIPSRYASTRLPGKPLVDIAGQTMIQRVVENAARSGAQFVWVATDDKRIAAVVSGFGADAILTSAQHETGTDRLAEVAQIKELSDDTTIVNVQGDEPLLEAHFIRQVAERLHTTPNAGVATLASAISNIEDVFNPNIVKVVLNEAGCASYFSRAPIPWDREAFKTGPPNTLPKAAPYLRHIGLYAYRAGALRALSSLPHPSIEKAEALEQLRALHAGISIAVGVVEEAPAHGVDTPEDLERVRAWFGSKPGNLDDAKSEDFQPRGS